MHDDFAVQCAKSSTSHFARAKVPAASFDGQQCCERFRALDRCDMGGARPPAVALHAASGLDSSADGSKTAVASKR